MTRPERGTYDKILYWKYKILLSLQVFISWQVRKRNPLVAKSDSPPCQIVLVERLS